MELALNLVWLCVAVVGLALLLFTLSRAATPSDPPPRNWRKVVAMSCVLVILFFVISMTDDLHDQEFLLEESKSSRIVAGTGTLSLSAPDRVVPVVFLLFSPLACFAPVLPSVRRPVEPPKVLFAAAIDGDRLNGRAPPACRA